MAGKGGVVLLTFRTSGTERAAKKAREVGEELDSTANRAKDSAGKLSNFASSVDDTVGNLVPFSTGLGDIASQLDNFTDGLGGTEGKLETWGKGLGIAAGAVGVGIGAAVVGGITKAIQLDDATNLVTAQLGLTEAESERVGSVAGAVYADAYGESIGQVTDVVGQVVGSIQGMDTASEDVLGRMTEHVLNFSEAFEQDTGRVTQVVGQMLTTGLAGDAEEAVDILTKTMQSVPANVRDDIMDAADEYGPFFSSLGLDGADAFGLLAKGAESGMYGIDKTGDALKELTIRSTDMSTGSVAAYEAMGLSAEDMTAKMLAGGDDAAEAFDQIVGGLLGMEDPSAQAQAALALFGTPLEDLGTDKIPGFLESLQGGTSALGDFEGAAASVDDTLNSGAGQGWKEMGRQFEGIIMQVGDYLLPLFLTVSDWFQDNPALMTAVVVALGALAVGLMIATGAVWAMNAGLFASPITWIILGITALVAAVVALWMNWDQVVAWVGETWSGFVSWLGETFQPLIDNWNSFWGRFGEDFSAAWETMKTIGLLAWQWIDLIVFKPFRDGIDLIVAGFETGASMIGTAWDGIKQAAAKPINFVLDTVWNNGLRSFWNDVVGNLGLDNLKLPKAELVAFAEGGVLPGYTPGRDVHQFYSPTGGRLALSGGEAIMRPEFTRAIGGPAGVDRLNAAARRGEPLAFADGGVWGAIGDFAGGIWDGITSAAQVAWKFISDPGGAIREYVVDGILRPLVGTEGNIFQRLFGELPITLVEGMADLFPSASEKTNASAGMGWEAMWGAIQSAYPDMVMTSNYRPGSRTVNGGQSYHALGRALDLIPASMDTFNKIAAMFPNASELIYTPAGDRQLRNGQPFAGWSPAVKAQHYNHVHLAMANGGVFPMLATGGPVEQGKGYIVGDGGVPEFFVPGADGYVYPEVPTLSGQSAADISASLDDVEMSVSGSGGGPRIIQIVMPDGRVLLETVLDEFADEEARL